MSSSSVVQQASGAAPAINQGGSDEARNKALEEHRKLLKEHADREKKLKERTQYLHSFCFYNDPLVRQTIKDMEKQYDRSEENIKALQSVGQIIGEVLKQLDDDRCTIILAIPLIIIIIFFSHCKK